MNDNALDSIVRLRDGLAGVVFSTDPDSRRETQAIIDQINDYILPRLKHLDAPLLAVIGGSTGSGKSTLVNALVGRRVSRSGVIRPTTRQPVLVSNPADADWFDSPHVLPGLAREHGDPDQNPEATSLRTVVADTLTPGLALLDAPDFDSIDDRNRALASQLLAAADLWVFVTTPARYADQLVWNFLHDAAGRDLQVIVVLNKVEEDSGDSVPNDLRRMMDEAQLHDAELFVIPDAGHVEDLLPTELVSPPIVHPRRRCRRPP